MPQCTCCKVHGPVRTSPYTYTQAYETLQLHPRVIVPADSQAVAGPYACANRPYAASDISSDCAAVSHNPVHRIVVDLQATPIVQYFDGGHWPIPNVVISAADIAHVQELVVKAHHHSRYPRARADRLPCATKT